VNNYVVGLISFGAIFGGVLFGVVCAHRLPRHHLSSETQSVVTVSVAVIGTLSALVLGLMISAANSSYTKASDEVKDLSLQLIRIERNLRRYGPEATEARATLHLWGIAKMQQLFPENGKPSVSSETTIRLLETVQDAVLDLTPQNERQKYLRTLCVTLTSTMIQARWALEQTGHNIPATFLIVLIFWLTIVFASFGLFAPRNPTALGALFLCSIAVAGGIALIQDLSDPGTGLIRFPSDPMRKALTEIARPL
jgi:ABC-type amino acid transport system permease subunit